MKLLISEIIKKASNAKTKAEKIKILRDNNSQALRSVLKWNFEPAIKSENLWRFIKGANSLSRFKREQLFIQMLEGLHESEADIICLVKDKQLHKKYRITKAVVTSAFPNIQWSE